MSNDDTICVSTVPAEFLKPGPVKVVLLGNSSVGKSCIINYLANGQLINPHGSNLSTTLGPPKPFGRVRVSTGEGDVVLDFWDTCGSERFFSIGSQYMRNSKAAVFVYDIRRHETFESIFKGNNEHGSWLDEFLMYWSPQEKELFPIFILGNMVDLSRHPKLKTENVRQRLSKEAEGRELKPFLFWETSALTGENLENFSKVLGEHFPSNTESWQTGAHLDGNNAVNINVVNRKKSGKDDCKCRK